MVADVLKCLKAYKVQKEIQGLDFDGDRKSHIRELRKEMAKLYDEEKIFGVVEITPSKVSMQEFSKEKKDLYLQ